MSIHKYHIVRFGSVIHGIQVKVDELNCTFIHFTV